MIIATRERPELLVETVKQTVPMIGRDDTRLLICVDEDDKATLDCLKMLPKDGRITVSVKPREDSRGEKYDRALKEAPADIYLPSVDYEPILTPGFDQAIINAARIWPDGIGVVYTMMCDELVPLLQAPTAKYVEKMGYIYSHDYPYWFIDHEMADIAWMIGRINFADVKTNVSKRPSKTIRMWDVDFWATYYDLMALERRNKARAIINSPEFEAPDWLKLQMCNWFPLVERRSEGRNARVRSGASHCEQARGEQGERDAGYLRAKAKAEAKLQDLLHRWKAAA